MIRLVNEEERHDFLKIKYKNGDMRFYVIAQQSDANITIFREENIVEIRHKSILRIDLEKIKSIEYVTGDIKSNGWLMYTGDE